MVAKLATPTAKVCRQAKEYFQTETSIPNIGEIISMNSMPFPSYDDGHLSSHLKTEDTDKMPWKKLHANEITPLTFEVRHRSGEITTFPYSDFRGTRLLNAGYLIVNIYSMEKYHVIVEGRNLAELARHLSLGRIQWFGETPNIGYELPETDPHIETITIEALTGP